VYRLPVNLVHLPLFIGDGAEEIWSRDHEVSDGRLARDCSRKRSLFHQYTSDSHLCSGVARGKSSAGIEMKDCRYDRRMRRGVVTRTF
jgi:hypothetical protein